MSIALIGKDETPVVLVGKHLTDWGAEPSYVLGMHEVLNEGKVSGDADLVFLILTAHDFLSTGAAVKHICAGLGEKRKLVLCIKPAPDREQRLRLLKYGAEEVISPASAGVEQIAERVLAHLILKRRVRPYRLGKVLGATPAMRKIYDLVRQYAPLSDLSVLLRGETGTGKGMLAEELHNEAREQTGRRGEFVPIHCKALNPSAVEAELFGHVKGSFTGALTDRKGLVEEANHGSLLVDEIGDFDVDLQIKLLDLVEHRRFRRVGANKFTEVDVRFIFATHCPLEQFIEEGRFREDLFGRIKELPLELPPLRRRKADIPLLVEHFLNDYNKRFNRNVTLGGGAVDDLFNCNWRLNVRGLRAAVHQAAASVNADEVITNFILSDGDREPMERRPQNATETPNKELIEINPLQDSLRALQGKIRVAYFKALAAVSENMEQASKLSEIGRSQLYEIFKEYDLHIGGKPAHRGGGKGQPD